MGNENDAEPVASVESIEEKDEDPADKLPVEQPYSRSFLWWCSVYCCCCCFRRHALDPKSAAAAKKKQVAVKRSYERLPRSAMRQYAAKKMSLEVFKFFRKRLINEPDVNKKKAHKLQVLPPVSNYQLMMSQYALKAVAASTEKSGENFAEQIEMRREHQDSMIKYMQMINMQIENLRAKAGIRE